MADFTGNPEVKSLSHPELKHFMLSLDGALAGGIIVASYRQSFIAGVPIALAIIYAAAMIGMSVVIDDWQLAWQGAERLGQDVLFIHWRLFSGLHRKTMDRAPPQASGVACFRYVPGGYG